MTKITLAVAITPSMILLLAMDIHVHPGPSLTNNDISIMHINTESLSKKLDMISVKAINHDIITLSETWLLDRRNKDSDLILEGFYSPIRKRQV